jgi:limonene 1,2-monooxygenase
MMGIPTVEQRKRMNEALDAIMLLLQAEEAVTMKTDWFELNNAKLQLASYSEPHLPVAVAASFTPAGPTAAGRHGVGLLSVAGVDNSNFERTWGWAEEASAESGKPISRNGWKVVVPIHLADSKEEALNDIRQGWDLRAYVGDRNNPDIQLGQAGLFGAGGTLEEQAENGSMLVGTPDDAVKAIQVIQERSGGIGGILGLAHEWASTEKTNRSYELFARYVAPHFQGQLTPVIDSRNWVEEHMGEVFGATPAAMARAFKDAGKELPAQMAEMLRQRQEAREAATTAAAGSES